MGMLTGWDMVLLESALLDGKQGARQRTPVEVAVGTDLLGSLDLERCRHRQRLGAPIDGAALLPRLETLLSASSSSGDWMAMVSPTLPTSGATPSIPTSRAHLFHTAPSPQ